MSRPENEGEREEERKGHAKEGREEGGRKEGIALFSRLSLVHSLTLPLHLSAISLLLFPPLTNVVPRQRQVNRTELSRVGVKARDERRWN